MHDDDALHAWFIFNLHTKSHLYLHNMQSIVNQENPFVKRKKQKETQTYLEV
jgi:hypothetical protein